MKNTVASVCVMVLLLSLVFSTPQLGCVKLIKGDSEASLMWGTQFYSNEYELNASRYTSDHIYDCFDDAGIYDLCEDYWGDPTQPDAFYSNVSDCAKNYDYATVFYKGHTAKLSCENHFHTALADNDSLSSGDQLIDNWIHYYAYRQSGVQPKIHRFVFLWSCSNDDMGWFNSTHCYGMTAAWFNRTDLSEDAYPYDGSDDSDVCYIGFENISRNFVKETGYGDPPGYNYGDFCRRFYDYATDPLTYTIRLSLYYASYDTIGCSYLYSDLYQGYTITYNGTEYECRQVVYGDAHEDLPD